MVFLPGGEVPEAVQVIWEDTKQVWAALQTGNACAVQSSIRRLLRDLDLPVPLAQGNCQCSSCMFAIGQCAVISPECATPCVDDPTKYCLYCVNGCGIPGREYHEIGRFDTAEEWQQALQEQMQACGCGPGKPWGQCGTLSYTITETASGSYECCQKYWIFRCYGTYKDYEGNCAVGCDQPCGEEYICVPKGLADPLPCRRRVWRTYDSSSCCERCSDRPNCGCPTSGTGGICSQEIVNEPDRVEIQCECDLRR